MRAYTRRVLTWLNEQDPLVVISIGFVAGGVVQAIIDLLGRELSARWEANRQLKRQQRQAWLDEIDLTAKHLVAYQEFLIARIYGPATYSPLDYVGASLELVNDRNVLRRLSAVVAKLHVREVGAIPPPEEITELSAARYAASDVLGDQKSRVLAGKEPERLPAAEMEAIAGIQAMFSERVARVYAPAHVQQRVSHTSEPPAET